jgi:hypothetical protein
MEQQYRHRAKKQSSGPKESSPNRAGKDPQQAGPRMDDSPQHAPESGEPTETGRESTERGERGERGDRSSRGGKR